MSYATLKPSALACLTVGYLCRQRKKGKQAEKKKCGLASIAVEGLAKVAMHAGRWQSNPTSGMEESQLIQVPTLIPIFGIHSLCAFLQALQALCHLSICSEGLVVFTKQF